MTKQQKQKFDNLYKFSNEDIEEEQQEGEPISKKNTENKNIKNKSIENKSKNKQNKRNKNIVDNQKNIHKKNNIKNQFDFDTEVVIGMTKKNRTQTYGKENNISKKQSKIIKKKKRIKKIIKYTTLLFLIIGGVVFAMVSPIFNISDINVINNEKISTDTIKSLSQLQIGQNIFQFTRGKVEQQIEENPYIKDANIKRKIPNKVEITIEERKQSYNVEFLNGYAYIDNQGYILEVSENKLELPVIQGISTPAEKIIEGNRLEIEDLEKLETVLQITNICENYELNQMISWIDITDKNDYIIYMEQEKKTIYIGDGSNLSNKMLYVTTIIEENKGIEGTIYVNGDINKNFKSRFKEKV